jgi:GAF domain-containing protein
MIMETDTEQEIILPVNRTSYGAGQALAQQLSGEFSLQIVEGLSKVVHADAVIFYLYDPVSGYFNVPPYVSGTLFSPETYQAMHPVQPHILSHLVFCREPIFAPSSESLYYLLHDAATPVPELHFYQREQIRSTAVIPLCIEAKLVGVLFIHFRQPQQFDLPQRQLIESLAYYAAISINMSQALNTLSKRRIRELEILQSIDRELNANLELTEVLSTILRLGHDHVPASRASIILPIPGQRSFTTIVRMGQNVEEPKSLKILSVDMLGITHWAMQHRRSVRVDNVHSDKPWCNIYVQLSEETVSELDVPLIDGDEVIGVFNFEGQQEGAFCEEDQQFLETLAGQAALTIKKSQAFESEKKAAERFELLYEAGRELSKVVDHTQLDLAYATIVSIVQKRSQCSVVIRRYDEDSQELVVVSSSYHRHLSPIPRLRIHQSFNVHHGKTVVIRDINEGGTQYQWIKFADPKLVSLVIIPFVFKSHYYGDISLGHDIANYFDDADITFFEALAQQLASVLSRLEVIEERQEFQQRAIAAEEMSTISDSTFELVHRLGNSLGLVGYYINAIQEELQVRGVVSEYISEKLELIDLSASSVLNLSNQLKQKVVRTAAEMHDDPVLFPPHVLLDETLGEITIPTNIQICCQIEPSVAKILIYPNLVVNSLHNLIMNAIQAMPEGGELTCSIYNRGNSVVFEIKDTGIGIPPGQHTKIFNLFYSTKKSSGFGLWSARRNALKNRGKLELQRSVPGRGTTFVLLFPQEGVYE